MMKRMVSSIVLISCFMAVCFINPLIPGVPGEQPISPIVIQPQGHTGGM